MGGRLARQSCFLHEMVSSVVATNESGVPRASPTRRKLLLNVLMAEELRFTRTLESGLKKLQDDISELPYEGITAIDDEIAGERARRSGRAESRKVGWSSWQAYSVGMVYAPYDGRKAFKLYDTYGLPRDFIEDVLRDAKIEVDWPAFDEGNGGAADEGPRFLERRSA